MIRPAPWPVLATAAFLLSACTVHSSTSGVESRTGVHAPLVAAAGGTVSVAVDGVPTTLNDHTMSGDDPATRAVASLVWAQVFQIGPGASPKLDTTVVQSAEVVSVNPQTVVYQINPAAVWSDGTPISAQDFVYAWLSQSGTGQDVDGTADSVASTAGYRDIASVVGSNAGRTVTVVFQTPFADWPSLFNDLLPAHVAEHAGWNHGFDHFDAATLVSAGPWVVSAWRPGEMLELSPNPHWWGPAPHLDHVVLQAMAGAPAMAQALRAGQVQVAEPGAFDGAFAAAVSSSPFLQSRSSLGTTVLQLVFNTRHAPLDLPAVRQGIAHGVDRPALVTALAQPLDSLVWEDNDHLFANSQLWYADDAAGYESADPATAARLLATGGLVADGNGTWTLSDAPVVLHLTWASDDPWSAGAGPAIAAQLVNGGFDVVTQPVSMAQLLGTVLPMGDFDLALAPLSTGPYPSAMAAAFGTPTVATSTSLDWSGFDDPKIDALFVQASQQLAASQAQLLYQQIDSALWTSMPSLPLFAEPTVAAWDVRLAGVDDDPGGLGLLWSVDRWTRLIPAPQHVPVSSQPKSGG